MRAQVSASLKNSEEILEDYLLEIRDRLEEKSNVERLFEAAIETAERLQDIISQDEVATLLLLLQTSKEIQI